VPSRDPFGVVDAVGEACRNRRRDPSGAWCIRRRRLLPLSKVGKVLAGTYSEGGFA
jgi:hypothetical protein